MARIRSIKPEFSRDERLQDLEAANPGQHTMLVFACLWPHCDKNGNFPWNSRQLHLDILPFLQFDFDKTLTLLREALVITQYEASDGKLYGSVVNFCKHQRINGKEAQDPPKYPPGSDREAIGMNQLPWEGEKGGEMEREGVAIPEQQPPLNYARRMMQVLSLPQSDGLRRTIEAAVAAECGYLGIEPVDAAQQITDKAITDRQRGMALDKFYFEDTKWRNGNGTGRRISATSERAHNSKTNILDGLGKNARRRDSPDGDELQVGTRQRISS